VLLSHSKDIRHGQGGEGIMTKHCTSFQATIVNIQRKKMAVFWVVAPCSLVEVYHGNHPYDGGSKYLWNVGKLLPDYMVLQPIRQPPSCLPPWEPQILCEYTSPPDINIKMLLTTTKLRYNLYMCNRLKTMVTPCHHQKLNRAAVNDEKVVGIHSWYTNVDIFVSHCTHPLC
jgi:hypothetical protein